MKIIKQNESTEISVNNPFDTFCQAFNGNGFYGLEYVLEDVFQDINAKPVSGSPVVDWFGLYG